VALIVLGGAWLALLVRAGGLRRGPGELDGRQGSPAGGLRTA
jgi:hypothetical protein